MSLDNFDKIETIATFCPCRNENLENSSKVLIG